MIEVREVKTKKEQKQFVNLHINLYKGNKAWCPPLYADEFAIFKPDYPFLDTADAKFWIAYKDGEVVGRIGAIYQKASNEKWGQKRVRFNRFDCINDQEVADALFEKVEEYARSLGMKEVVGPLGFNDLDREGLLVEGFDYLNTYEEHYNADYYEKLINNRGYKTDAEWIEHRIFPHDEQLDKVIRIADKIESKGELHTMKTMKFKEFVKKYKDEFFEIYDGGYEGLYGSVPSTPATKQNIIDTFGIVINMKYLKCALDKDGHIKALALVMPNFTEILQKSNGHLYPLTIFKLLHTVRHPKKLDLGFVTCAKGENLAGGIALVYGRICEQVKKDKIEFVETNLNLINNKAIISTWDHFDHIQHKRRRTLLKTLD